jgi:hypothetical protein
MGGSGEPTAGVPSRHLKSREVGQVRKLHVVALMVALIYVTTWVLAAHARPRADVAHPAVVVHVGVSANPFEMGG